MGIFSNVVSRNSSSNVPCEEVWEVQQSLEIELVIVDSQRSFTKYASSIESLNAPVETKPKHDRSIVKVLDGQLSQR